MYRIKNTADDRTKHLLHRTATQFELEPSLGGHRIRLGTHHDIGDEHYTRVKPVIDQWVKKGMVEVFPVLQDGTDSRKFVNDPEYDVSGLRLGGPTIEEWTNAGYQAENYPPEGYAEVFSPGLVAFRRAQEATQEAAQKADEAIKNADAFSSQVILEQLPPASIIITEEPPLPAPSVVETIPVQTPTVTIPPVATTPSLNKNKKLR